MKKFELLQIQVVPIENWALGKDVILKRNFMLPTIKF